MAYVGRGLHHYFMENGGEQTTSIATTKIKSPSWSDMCIRKPASGERVTRMLSKPILRGRRQMNRHLRLLPSPLINATQRCASNMIVSWWFANHRQRWIEVRYLKGRYTCGLYICSANQNSTRWLFSKSRQMGLRILRAVLRSVLNYRQSSFAFQRAAKLPVPSILEEKTSREWTDYSRVTFADFRLLKNWEWRKSRGKVMDS